MAKLQLRGGCLQRRVIKKEMTLQAVLANTNALCIVLYYIMLSYTILYCFILHYMGSQAMTDSSLQSQSEVTRQAQTTLLEQPHGGFEGPRLKPMPGTEAGQAVPQRSKVYSGLVYLRMYKFGFRRIGFVECMCK